MKGMQTKGTEERREGVQGHCKEAGKKTQAEGKEKV